ncbi:MAG: hypothetical protein BJ554DRAFT_3737, partial [Olpidium bornovanus]
DVNGATFTVGAEAITRVSWAPESDHLATADAGFAVGIFSARARADRAPDGAAAAAGAWVYVGRYQAHTKPVIAQHRPGRKPGLLFSSGRDGNGLRLSSFSEDRTVAEYDLKSSTVSEGVKLKVGARFSVIFFYIYKEKEWSVQKKSRTPFLPTTPLILLLLLPRPAFSARAVSKAAGADRAAAGLLRAPRPGERGLRPLRELRRKVPAAQLVHVPVPPHAAGALLRRGDPQVRGFGFFFSFFFFLR